MIITCPACASRFRIPDGALGAEGRKLRCGSCRHVWFQPADAVEPASAPEPEPVAVPVEAAPPVAEPTPAAPVQTTATEPEPADEGDEAVDEPVAEGDTTAAGAEPSSRPRPESDSALAPDEQAAEATPAAEVATAPDDEAAADEVPVENAADADPDEAPALTEPEAPMTFPEPEPVFDPRGVAPRQGAATQAASPAGSDREQTPVAANDSQAGGEPRAPAYDISRVVAPDSAPAEETRKPARKRRRSGRVLVLLLLVAAVAALYTQRTTVMRYLPQTMALYDRLGLVETPSSVGLQLKDVTFKVTQQDGQPVLEVNGIVVNAGGAFRRLPRMRAELLDGSRRTRDFWTFDALGRCARTGRTDAVPHDLSQPAAHRQRAVPVRHLRRRPEVLRAPGFTLRRAGRAAG